MRGQEHAHLVERGAEPVQCVDTAARGNRIHIRAATIPTRLADDIPDTQWRNPKQ